MINKATAKNRSLSIRSPRKDDFKMRFYRNQAKLAVSIGLSMSLALVACGKKDKEDEDQATGTGTGSSNSNPTGGGSTGRVPTGSGSSVDLSLYGSDGEPVISTMRLVPGQLTTTRSSLRYAEMQAADLDVVSPLLASYVFPSQPQQGKTRSAVRNLVTNRAVQSFTNMEEIKCTSQNLIVEAAGDSMTMVTDFDSSRDCTPKISMKVLAYATESIRCQGADFTSYKGKSFSDELLQKEVSGCDALAGFGAAHTVMQVRIEPTEESGIVRIQQITEESQGIGEKTCMSALVQETPDYVYEKQEACTQTSYLRLFTGKASEFKKGAMEVLVSADSLSRSVGLFM
jgi:hypothetical protein